MFTSEIYVWEFGGGGKLQYVVVACNKFYLYRQQQHTKKIKNQILGVIFKLK